LRQPPYIALGGFSQRGPASSKLQIDSVQGRTCWGACLDT